MTETREAIGGSDPRWLCDVANAIEGAGNTEAFDIPVLLRAAANEIRRLTEGSPARPPAEPPRNPHETEQLARLEAGDLEGFKAELLKSVRGYADVEAGRSCMGSPVFSRLVYWGIGRQVDMLLGVVRPSPEPELPRCDHCERPMRLIWACMENHPLIWREALGAPSRAAPPKCKHYLWAVSCGDTSCELHGAWEAKWAGRGPSAERSADFQRMVLDRGASSPEPGT